jgi:hypothetical protein
MRANGTAANSPVIIYTIKSQTNTFSATHWGIRSDIFAIEDYDGDGRDDITVFRPSSGTWYVLKSSDNNLVSRVWGAATDAPLTGDFDGDGKADFNVRRNSNGVFYVLQNNGKQKALLWGTSSDKILTSAVFD